MAVLNPPPPLPVELIEMIIEHLHPKGFDDYAYRYAKQALRACALVSRTWHSIVRPHLFREVDYSFTTQHDCNAQLEATRTTRTTLDRPRTFEEIHAFLMSHPLITRYIRKLHLRQKWDRRHEFSMLSGNSFHSLLRVVPHLYELSLVNVTIAGSIDDEFHMNQRSLGKLDLAYIVGFPPATCLPQRAGLPELISCATKIDHLVLSGLEELSWEDEIDIFSVDPASSDILLSKLPVVHSVTLDGVYNEFDYFVPLFQTSLRGDTVRSLILTGDELSIYAPLLRYAGPHLETLQLFLNSGYTGAEDGSLTLEFDTDIIHPCGNLRELILYMFLACDDESQFENQLITLLEFLKASEIRQRLPKLSNIVLQIDLEIEWSGTSDGVMGTWEPVIEAVDPEQVNEELDTLLVSIVETTSVSQITIQWAEHQTYVGPETEAFIRGIFPTLSSNGMLAFRNVDQDSW